MKPKKILTIALTLVFLFTSALPAFAEEGDLPVIPEQEETVPPSELDGDQEPAPVPEEPPVPEPDESEEQPNVPEELPDEGEDIPPSPAEPEIPGEDGETPDTPQSPEEGEVPGEEEQLPEDEETPDEEIPDEETPEEEEEPAEDEEEEEPAPEEEGPVINVVVPPSGQVIINPYRMKVATSVGESTEQIVHEPQALVNLSEVPVQVDAWAVGTLAGESKAAFVAAPPAESAEEKMIFMYLEFQPFPDQWTNWYDNFDNQLLVTNWGESKANVMTLPVNGEGWYRLTGAMTNFPKEMWQAEDAASVTVVFSFTPVAETSEISEIPEVPEISEVPDAPGNPEISEAPGYPDLPETSEPPEPEY